MLLLYSIEIVSFFSGEFLYVSLVLYGLVTSFLVSVREVLNKIRWTGDMREVEVWYVHRGAPDDCRVVSGNVIEDVGRSFLVIGAARIPHHRVFRIVYQGCVVFERSAK